jgi:hypothetical protein
VVLSLLLASCGGGRTNQAANTNGASAQSGTTSTTPGSDAGSGPGTHNKSRAKRAPRASHKVSRRVKRKQRQLNKKIRKIERKAKRKAKRKAQRPANQGAAPPAKTAPPPSPQQSASPQVVLFNKAKRICDTLTLNGLAQRYNVKATPEAVSSAYAASYPETFRKAVHDGCLAAF